MWRTMRRIVRVVAVMRVIKIDFVPTTSFNVLVLFVFKAVVVVVIIIVMMIFVSGMEIVRDLMDGRMNTVRLRLHLVIVRERVLDVFRFVRLQLRHFGQFAVNGRKEWVIFIVEMLFVWI